MDGKSEGKLDGKIDEKMEPVKAKRGRKSKAELLKLMIESEANKKIENEVQNNFKEVVNEKIEIEAQQNTEQNQEQIVDEIVDQIENLHLANVVNDSKDEEEVLEAPVAKKRGRKPKGGKIIQQNIHAIEKKEEKPNIILHLKCHLKDLNAPENEVDNNLESFCFTTSKNELTYDVIYKAEIIDNELYQSQHSHEHISENVFSPESLVENKCDNKEIWKKMKILEKSLHLNNLTDKKSACFWCSYDFDNMPIHIPKFFMKNSYHVYGCFCSPECAVAHLMSENIDSSTKFERYHLLNHIYSKIYDYRKSIKPAPDPHYMLERYYGNLTIQEYRALLKTERLFLVVDKPLTRVLPELHEDNDEFIINNKIIPSSNHFQVKTKILRKPANKTAILQENFGMNSSFTE